MDETLIGIRAGEPHRTQLLTEDKAVEAFLRKPWGKRWVMDKLDLVEVDRNHYRERHDVHDKGDDREITVSHEALSRHSLIVGATGAGKSRLFRLLLKEQFQENPEMGGLILCAKRGDFEQAIALCSAYGRDVIAIDPASARQPSWNPMEITSSPDSSDFGEQVAWAVEDVTTAVRAVAGNSPMPRAEEILKNALFIIGEAVENPSLFELVRFLTDDDYRKAVLQFPMRTHAGSEAAAYFNAEFSRLGKGAQAEAVGPVTNKLREVVRSRTLFTLMCSEYENTIDLADIFFSPTTVVALLDKAILGQTASRFLAAMLTHGLFRTALRVEADSPAILACDELGYLADVLGEVVEDIAEVARAQKLRLLFACQRLNQLSESVRWTLLSNSALLSFFRLGWKEAEMAAEAIARSDHPRTLSILLANTKESDWYSASLCDARGNPLLLTSAGWRVARARSQSVPMERALQELATVFTLGALTLEQTALPLNAAIQADKSAPVLSSQIGVIRLNDVAPRVVRRSTESDADLKRRWSKDLQELPNRHCVIMVDGRLKGLCETVPVPDIALCEKSDYALLPDDNAETSRAYRWEGVSHIVDSHQEKAKSETARKLIRKKAPERPVNDDAPPSPFDSFKPKAPPVPKVPPLSNVFDAFLEDDGSIA